MSQFLWVEDFGNVAVDATTESVFGEMLGDEEIPANKYRLTKFLEHYGVLLKLDFWEGLDFIRNPEQLFRVDYIILDVLLPVPAAKNQEYLRTLLQRYDADEKIARTQLQKTAGFQLYVKLVMELGFPKEHILFCSNHAEELASIREAFEKSKMDLKPIFTKEEEERDKVQAWVRERSENHYSLLRRGILNVLYDIKNKNVPLTPPFADADDPINAFTFLEGLRFMLKNIRKEPADDEKQYLYLSLCDYLTKHFERFSKELLYRGLYRGKNFEVVVDKEYIIPSDFVRNWIAHGIFMNAHCQLFSQDVGFIFILVMKSMFDYPCLKVFKSLYPYSVVRDKDLIRKLSDLHEYYSYPKECDIFELIRVKGEKKLNSNWQQEPFMAHTYASFLFNCLKSGFFRETLGERAQYKKTRTQRHQDERGYFFNLSYRIDKKEKDELFEKLMFIAYHGI